MPGIVGESALVLALETVHLGGAAVDVLSEEPPRNGNPLLDTPLPNLIVTPYRLGRQTGPATVNPCDHGKYPRVLLGPAAQRSELDVAGGKRFEPGWAAPTGAAQPIAINRVLFLLAYSSPDEGNLKSLSIIVFLPSFLAFSIAPSHNWRIISDRAGPTLPEVFIPAIDRM